MILVVGATGEMGSDICRRLRDEGKAVRGVVRKTAGAAKLERLQSMGVELVYGDLRDRASLDAACRGMDAVITTATTTLSRQPGDSIEATDRDGVLNLVAAAKDAGVGHFIYTSYSGHIDATPDPCALTQAKRAVESAVQASGMAYTILRPTYFMEVWLSPTVGFDYANATVAIYGAGKSPISWIARGDAAEFAVKSVDNPQARNAVVELGGPEALSPLQAVSVFEEVSGRPFTASHVPVEALQEQKRNAADSLQEAFAALMLSHEAGDAIPMEETARAYGVELSGVREYAVGVLQPA